MAERRPVATDYGKLPTLPHPRRQGGNLAPGRTDPRAQMPPAGAAVSNGRLAAVGDPNPVTGTISESADKPLIRTPVPWAACVAGAPAAPLGSGVKPSGKRNRRLLGRGSAIARYACVRDFVHTPLQRAGAVMAFEVRRSGASRCNTRRPRPLPRRTAADECRSDCTLPSPRAQRSGAQTVSAVAAGADCRAASPSPPRTPPAIPVGISSFNAADFSFQPNERPKTTSITNRDPA